MINARNYGAHFPFTASQWQELEHQVLAFRYLMSGFTVPPDLMSSVIRTTSNSSSSRLIFQQQTLPGWGCFQAGYGRKVDPEPGRCKRTDGKKWRCSKEAHPDSKYCERHMHRGKRAKKNTEVCNTTTSKTSTNPKFTDQSCFSSPVTSCSVSSSQTNSCNTFYPFLSTQSSSADGSLSTQGNIGNTPHWLLDHELYDQPSKKEIRYSDEMKGVVTSSSRCSELALQDIGFKIDKEHKEGSLGLDNEQENHKPLHHFLGDWPTKLKSSHAVGAFNK